MKGNFGKTNFGGIIMHGMNNFGLISRMITDWAYPAGAIHRRLETRWVKPVRPGDTIQPTGIVKSKQATEELALGSDRRHGAQPERREGRDRRGHGRVPDADQFGSSDREFERINWRLEWPESASATAANRPESGPIRIDIRLPPWLRNRPSRAAGRWRDKSHFATFGSSGSAFNTAFQSIRIVP